MTLTCLWFRIEMSMGLLLWDESVVITEKGQPLPKFGEWDVNDPASAEGFTVIFNKARNEKKTGGKPESPAKDDTQFKHGTVLGKPQSVSFYLTMLMP
ncbi:hypothetical protein Patl1_01812 [Pistacia atlantica]|uniref:Uncharacterized protein n=1 Tax=Pistacia atlantica TaxID=434234 RepID=A0ACC1CD13_9ROSI|nr:hypothetical protein Patl1_01812 [Pistacia atlantica]